MKLDLHTHCREATACPTPTLDIAKNIVAAVKAKGLDGIATTEHYTERYGHELKEIVDRQLNAEILVIPGQELDRMFFGRERGVFHVVELYLPDEVTFRFIAHPGHPYVRDLGAQIDGSIHGIELKNPSHADEMDEGRIRQLAEQHDLILLTNSDAHALSDIGSFYNEIDLQQLSARATAA
ncbi:MAG: PHP domain-containing protein [Dehalococcoidia bacterium]